MLKINKAARELRIEPRTTRPVETTVVSYVAQISRSRLSRQPKQAARQDRRKRGSRWLQIDEQVQPVVVRNQRKGTWKERKAQNRRSPRLVHAEKCDAAKDANNRGQGEGGSKGRQGV